MVSVTGLFLCRKVSHPSLCVDSDFPAVVFCRFLRSYGASFSSGLLSVLFDRGSILSTDRRALSRFLLS